MQSGSAEAGRDGKGPECICRSLGFPEETELDAAEVVAEALV